MARSCRVTSAVGRSGTRGEQLPQPLLEAWCRDRMSEPPVLLESNQREIVEQVIHEQSGVRQWSLHAVNCRSNHCHVVVTALSYDGEQVRDQFKAWGTRRLKEHQQRHIEPGQKVRENWWTRKGSVRQVFDEESLAAAVMYTLEAQDRGGSKGNV